MVATKGVLAPLHESRLVLQDSERLLKALDFGFATGFPFFVGFWLSDAATLDLGIVVKDSRKLGAGGIPVATEIRDALVQALVLLGLVLHILRLHCHTHLVLLSGLLVHGHCIGLLS